MLLSRVPVELTAGLSSVPARQGVALSTVSLIISLSLTLLAPTAGWRCVCAGLEAVCSGKWLTRWAPFLLEGELGCAASVITGQASSLEYCSQTSQWLFGGQMNCLRTLRL